MPSKPSTKKRKARKPTEGRRDAKINFSDFEAEDYLKTEESIRAFEIASAGGDAEFMAIVDDIAGRARKRLRVARSRTKRRV